MEQYRFLRGGIYIIEGIIAAGKTTLGKSIESYLTKIGIRCKFFCEYVNKPMLDLYLSDMKKYSFAFQLFMLEWRMHNYRLAYEYAKKGGVAILDRSILGDNAFALMLHKKGFISNEELKIYHSILEKACLPPPSRIIFLNCTETTSMTRLTTRGIESEIKGYSPEYLKELKDAYTESFQMCSATVSHININWDENKKREGKEELLEDSMIIQFIANLK